MAIMSIAERAQAVGMIRAGTPIRQASSYLIVGAIDFGTTYSGWAFSFFHDYKSDPTKISVKHWHSGSGTLVTEKTPTVALIKPDGKTLEAFGYDAENRFKELVENEEQEGYYYFRRFKMALNKNMDEKISRHSTIEDDFGQSLSAMTVFSSSIKFLTDDMIEEAKKQLGGALAKDDVKWVLTVPAIWTDSAKQFMREAAIEAGIDTENLKVALEPEAASIFCRYLSVERTVDRRDVSVSQFAPETKYMTLDAGGGTIDITVHEIQQDGGLKEVHAASGGGWGGILVDEAFKTFVTDLIGKGVYAKFTKEETDDWLDLWRDFETKKKYIDPKKNSKVIMRFPMSISTIFEKSSQCKLADDISRSKYSNDVDFVGDKIKLQASLMKELFKTSIKKTVDHVKMIMKHPKVKDIKAILMVGGFSDSPMLQTAVKEACPEVTVIIPIDAVATILKGAVIFGHKPEAITMRVLRYTYGISMSDKFVEGKHPESRRIVSDKGDGCRGVFSKHVEIYQSVKFGQSIPKKRYVPCNKSDTEIGIRIYASELENPEYVDECCTKIGETVITFPEFDGDVDNRCLLVQFTFGGTEIEVSAENEKTGKAVSVNVNYLG